MATERLTLADLRKSGTITGSEIVAAVDAYVHNPAAGPYRFASGHSLDIAAAVATSEEFAKMVARPGSREKVFRTAVTTAAMCTAYRAAGSKSPANKTAKPRRRLLI